MKIGIVGCGIVGGALKFGFEKLGHTVIVHDIKLQTSITDVFDTDIIYICVPTPMKEDGSCDISTVRSVIHNIATLASPSIFKSHIVIKSTVPPGTTEQLSKEYNRKIYFVPEFLRERCAISDFVENHKVLVIGSDDPEAIKVISSSHGHYPKTYVVMSTTEAELLKYYHNCINALRVTFANEIYDIAQQMGADYTVVKNALLKTTDLPDIYLDVNQNIRSYSSICWNKDVPALISLAKKMNLDLPLLYNIPVSNDRHTKTPFAGTRE